jgi:hypothetical protein
MRPRNIARDGKAKAAAAGLQIAAFVQTMERPERLLAQSFGNAGPIVVHQNGNGAAFAPQRHSHVFAVLQRVVDQIGDAALERVTAHRKHNGLRRHGEPVRSRTAHPRRRRGGIVHDVRKIARHNILAAFAAREIEILVEHVLHLADVVVQGFRVQALGHHGDFERHARQRRFQVVAYTGQHFRALLNITLDAFTHGDECLRRAANFRGAGRLEIRHRPSLAETFRRPRQPFDRPHLVAQECDGDSE